ncbi:MAG: acylneuraminate cytidylyltransferase family protein [Candidatus Scalindua sp.]|jgi:CMP-N-acetylneuraminic acid synthetase|nr:acylneuraminate cytidylyltransferase family protein [Candidatus Scalindua sp.]
MNVVALICARGGSKGLPGKNIRPLAGKPLIAWAIDHIREVKRINRIIVSTDSEEIASVASNFGAEIPFLRPAELAQDNSSEWMVWQHAMEYLKKIDGYYPDVLIVVPTTAPLRSSVDLVNCLDEYEKGDVDIVVTATDAHRSPFFNMVKQNEDKTVSLVISPDSKVHRRQDAPVVYDMTTVAYVTSPEFVMNNKGVFDGRVGYVHVPVERALDIDTALDFRIAECLISDDSANTE